MNRGPAVIATAVALALINVAIASVAVSAARGGAFVPLWLSLVLLAAGLLAAAGAFVLWRDYLRSLRQT